MAGSCDNRCTSGQEGTCKCSCGGANHGTAKKAWDIIQDGGNAEVKGHGLDLFLELGGSAKNDEDYESKRAKIYAEIEQSNDDHLAALAKINEPGGKTPENVEAVKTTKAAWEADLAKLDALLKKKDNAQTVVVTNKMGTKVQTYRSESEFVKDLGKFIQKGRVEINATDAHNKRQIHLPPDETRSNKEPKITAKEAERQIREAGATVTRKDGEYKVNIPGGKEGTAYFTDDPKDAIETAKVMMGQHKYLTDEGYVLKGEKGFVQTTPFGSISYTKNKEDASFFYTKSQADGADFGNHFQKVKHHKPIEQFNQESGKYEKVRREEEKDTRPLAERRASAAARHGGKLAQGVFDEKAYKTAFSRQAKADYARFMDQKAKNTERSESGS